MSCLARFMVGILFVAPVLPLTAAEPAWQDKVDPWVLTTTRAAGTTELLVFLDHQADLRGAAERSSKIAKGRYVCERLRAAAAQSQPPILAELRARGLPHRPLWIANLIWVRGDEASVRMLASRSDVAHLYANPEVRMALPASPRALSACPQGVEPGLTHVGAPDFWSRGIIGEGAVVAGADTGYDWDHPALKAQYRGWDGASADHNYNWHDAIHSSGGVCGADFPEPCDDHGHGTHTMGTMVGDDGVATVGMAPGARWIGCRNMDGGVGTPARYLECFQFFLAPTDLNDQNPNPDLAPHVINNSWSCPPWEGCTDPNVLKTAVENLRAAGIMVVVSAGNSGSACETVSTPAAIYDASFTVGSTNLADVISGFSSRGPVVVDGSSRIKPDVTAPGESVCSAVPGTGYGIKTGTSMAGPHVAGLVGLLISAAPCLGGDVDALENHVTATAVPRTTAQACGSVPGSAVPNNTYGWGAVRAVLPPCIFSDGFESGDTSVWSSTVGPARQAPAPLGACPAPEGRHPCHQAAAGVSGRLPWACIAPGLPWGCLSAAAPERFAWPWFCASPPRIADGTGFALHPPSAALLSDSVPSHRPPSIWNEHGELRT